MGEQELASCRVPTQRGNQGGKKRKVEASIHFDVVKRAQSTQGD